MKNVKISIDNLVRQTLPWYKRLPSRLAWLRVLLYPLLCLFEQFDTWRRRTRLLINVTSQVKVLESYLRDKYGDIRIGISTFTEGALNLGLEIEGETHRADIALESEGGGVLLPLEGEMREAFGDVDFIVYIPAGINYDAIRADIERFRQAMVKYKIIQQ